MLTFLFIIVTGFKRFRESGEKRYKGKSFFSVYSTPCIFLFLRVVDGDIRMQLFACLVLELRPNHYSCLVLITVIVSLAGGKETGKCDSKLNSEHTYMTVQNNTSLPSHLLASAPRYQWNHHFIFSKNFLSWPKKLSFFLSKQEILFFADHMPTGIQ